MLRRSAILRYSLQFHLTISGIVFANNLSFDKNFNIYTYRNYYNGGGVAIADINNDGLLDVYLTGNIGPKPVIPEQR